MLSHLHTYSYFQVYMHAFIKLSSYIEKHTCASAYMDVYLLYTQTETHTHVSCSCDLCKSVKLK